MSDSSEGPQGWVRTSFALTKADRETLGDLKRRRGLGSLVAVIRAGLKVLALVTAAEENGGELLIRDRETGVIQKVWTI